MTQKVLVITGTKQSGKSTSAKFIHGLKMKEAGAIQNFRIDQDDDLLITLPTGEECLLDIHRQDAEFASWAEHNVWPFAKAYSFAEALKESIIRIFSVNPQYLYGSDAEKNVSTHVKWRNLQDILEKTNLTKCQKLYKDDLWGTFLTHRELMQEFGTICRVLDPDCWLRATWNKIKYEGFPFCVIDDGRYENEVDYSNEQNAIVVRLTLQPFQDTHSSELIHTVPARKFFAELDNKNMTIDQKNDTLRVLLSRIGL